MESQQRDYWNPWLETLDPARLKQIELKNFRKYVAYAMEHSGLYRQKLAGINPEDIKTMEDVRKLPLTDKEDLRLAQLGEKPSIYGDVLGVDPLEVSDFHQTSGTTGRPVYVPESYESWQWRVEVWSHILWMAGFRETDRVFVPFGYNVYVAFWEGHYAAEKVGCEVVPGGALDTKGRISKMIETRSTALMNTPTYGLHMAEVAGDMGIDPGAIGIRKMLCAGEPLADATRRLLERTWEAEVYDHIGGTEPCAWAAMCKDRNGMHIMEPFFLVEVLDVNDLSTEVGPGELGTVVVTPLGRRSFPLVRFNTKDLARKPMESGCSCGRTSVKIARIEGRTDHLLKIRGVLFTPVAVEECLRDEFPAVAEFEIAVRRTGIMDEVALKVETCEDMGSGACAELRGRIFERLKHRTNLTFGIEVVRPGELPRYQLKASRFKDLREEQK